MHKRNPFLHAPAPDAPASFAGTLTDLLAGLAIVAFTVTATYVLAGMI